MIIDLKEKSGLGLRLNTDKPQIYFDQDLKSSSPAIRTIDQMKDVLLDKNIQIPQELYYMYRDIHRIADESILKKYNLRYDVTAIKPDVLGREFMKTAGHYHPEDFGELYEVIYGRCFCLMQRPNLKNYRLIEEVIFLEALAGEKIVIPPGFGHILINTGPDCLVTSNWVSSRFQSRYELYKKAEGAAYFVTTSERELCSSPRLKISIGIIKNPHYQEVANISFVRPAEQIKKFGLIRDRSVYNLINNDPNLLDFLNHPLDYEYNDVFNAK
jgi:glucose-6-phosphate isomerase